MGTGRMGWALLAAAVPGAAMGAGAGRSPVAPDLGKLLECRSVRDPAARLACFDREAGAMGARLDQGQLVVVDKAQVREAQRQRFGLAAPGLELFTGPDGQRLTAVQAKVTGAVADPYGKWIVTLADGSRWHQIDDFTLAHAPGAGQIATVGRAAVGSFRMTVANQAMRVRRER